MKNKRMYLCLLGVLLTAILSNVQAEGPVVDPRITGQGQAIISCDIPIARTNGDLLDINEIATIDFLVSQDKVNWQPAGSSSVCSMTYDLTSIPDGQYYYTTSATDTGGRTSALSIEENPSEYAAWVVKRVGNPNSPTGIRKTFN